MSRHLKPFALALALAIHHAASAQQVPAIENTDLQPNYPAFTAAKTYTPLPPLSEDTLRLNPKEQKAVSLSDQWKNKPDLPVIGEDGSVNFLYGASMPSVVCAPLYACDVALQPKEVVLQMDVGDSARWKVTPATSGAGENIITHLVIKPADVGLTSNLIVHTNRRTYHMRLVSKKDRWMPAIAFSYPDDTKAQWAAYHEQYARPLLRAATSRQEDAHQHADLNFNYHVRGDATHWKPIRVYADQSKTYIQFPETAKNHEVPALVILGAGEQPQLVNYRMVNDRFVVDGIIDRAALISGVGRHQQRVDIIREGG